MTNAAAVLAELCDERPSLYRAGVSNSHWFDPQGARHVDL